MKIADVPLFRFGDKLPTGKRMPTYPIVFIWTGVVFPDYTWRTQNDTLPKGRVMGVGLVALKRSGDVLVPDFLVVDEGTYINWHSYRWEDHEVLCTESGIHFQHVKEV